MRKFFLSSIIILFFLATLSSAQTTTTSSLCGNSYCDFYETKTNCASDCTFAGANCGQGTIPSSGCTCNRGNITETSGYCCWGSYSNTPCATVLQTCTDSDNGQNYYTKGTGSGNYRGATTRAYQTYDDVCATSTQLNEAYCETSTGMLSVIGISCPSGCSNGACVSTTTTTSGCSVDSDCAITGTTWAGATFCDSTGLKVMQYKVAPTCQSGTCIFTTSVQAVKEDCTPSNKICDFTTTGGGVYACIAGTPPNPCAANSKITNRCICGSAVAGGAYYTWSGYDPGYCCGTGSYAYQTSPGPCPTTTTTPISNQTNATTTTQPQAQTGATSPPSQSTSTTQTGATSPAVLSNATTSTTILSTTTSSTTTTFQQTTTTTSFIPEKSVPSACADSDKGISIFSQGITSDDSGVFEDKCVESNLTEYYCKDGVVLSYTATCADGCNNGACTSPIAKLIQDLIALLKSIFGLK